MSRGEDRREARETDADMKKFYYLFGAVAAIGIGVVGYNVTSSLFANAGQGGFAHPFESGLWWECKRGQRINRLDVTTGQLLALSARDAGHER